MTKITFNFSPAKKALKIKIEKSDAVGIIVKIDNQFYFVNDAYKKYQITEKSFDTKGAREFYVVLPNGDYILRCVDSSYPTPNANHYLPFKERCKVKGKLITDASSTKFEYKETIEIIDKDSYKKLLNEL